MDAQARFEFLDHPADAGFVAKGATLEECFAAAGDALCDFGWEVEQVAPREAIEIRARAATLEDLLFSWLSEILYLNDAEQWLFRRFEVRKVRAIGPVAGTTGLSDGRKSGLQENAPGPAAPAAGDAEWEIVATAHGEKFDQARHHARTYIKAVTYHQLSVKQTESGWQATVYIDV